MTKKKTPKRNIFSELMEGLDAMKGHREGKVTLRTHKLPAADVANSPGPEFFVAVRKEFNVSRAVWANMLRVSPRTVEKWEQGGQVSPLATTFVELVSHYPDTIERLQKLPKRISGRAVRPESSRMGWPGVTQTSDHALSLDQRRTSYRPEKIKVLFVGEAPPAGGTFFYDGNSQVYRSLSEVLQEHLKHPQNFLKAFKDRGYYLDDLILDPIEGKLDAPRTSLLKQNIPLLAQRIAEYEPAIVVTILKRLHPYVKEAIIRAKITPTHYCVPFPGNGQQGNFRREMAKVVESLP